MKFDLEDVLLWASGAALAALSGAIETKQLRKTIKKEVTDQLSEKTESKRKEK